MSVFFSEKEANALTMLAGFTSVLSPGPEGSSTFFESVDEDIIGDFVKENTIAYTSLETNAKNIDDLTEQLKSLGRQCCQPWGRDSKAQGRKRFSKGGESETTVSYCRQ